MSNQPQASVRKSTTWTPPAGSLSAVGEPLPPPTRSMLLREWPRNCCVCVCQWPWCHLHLSPSPASQWGSIHTNSNSRPADRFHVPSLRRLSCAFRQPCALLCFTQRYHFASWKPQTEMRNWVQNKSELGSWQVKCSYGKTIDSECLVCAMRNFQRAPFTIRPFQRRSQPSKGPYWLLSKPCVHWENW